MNHLSLGLVLLVMLTITPACLAQEARSSNAGKRLALSLPKPKSDNNVAGQNQQADRGYLSGAARQCTQAAEQLRQETGRLISWIHRMIENAGDFRISPLPIMPSAGSYSSSEPQLDSPDNVGDSRR